MLRQGPQAKARFILDFAQQHFPSMLVEKKSADNNIAEFIREARSHVAAHKHIHQNLVVT